MSSATEVVDYPNALAKVIVEEIIEKEEITEFDVKLSIATTKGDNYAGVIHRATVKGFKKNGEKKDLNLILKTAPTIAREMFPIEKIYQREYECYVNILPTLDGLQKKYNIPEQDRLKYIKLHKGDLTFCSEILVLEDMNVLGFKMANRQKSLNADEMSLLMKQFAALHATSFALKKYDKESFDTFSKETIRLEDFPDMFKQSINLARDNAIEAMDDPICKEKLIAFGENMMDKFMNFVLPDEFTPYTVLCHGDCWTNNVLFKYENDKAVEVLLLDWQMIKHASPLVDIAYLMFSSADEELRANHYERLLELYYDSLKSNLAKLDCDVNECYPEAIFKMHIKNIMPVGLIMAFLTVPIFMSEGDDIRDLSQMLKTDIVKADTQLHNVNSKQRYEQRMRGVVRDFVRLDLI